MQSEIDRGSALGFNCRLCDWAILSRWLLLIVLFSCHGRALAQRTWADQTGKYQVSAALLAYSDQFVVLKTSNGELLSMAISDLSESDREFLKSKDAALVHRGAGPQKWSLANGLQVIGQVVSHEVKDITLQRRRGALYVNEQLMENLPPVYKALLPVVIGHFENQKFKDLNDMEAWFNARHGYRPAKYHCEGVKLALENGDEYVFPYFLFDQSDRQFLEAGGEEFRKTQEESEERRKQDLYMEVRAAEYKRAKEAEAQAQEQQRQQADLQIKMVQLGLLAVAADVADLWEVALVPNGGSIYQAQLVVVPARDSRQATQMALAKWPGYSAGPVRRVSNR